MAGSSAVSHEFPVDENARRVPYGDLHAYMTRVFLALDFPEGDAATIAGLMADGDLMGKDSHGCIRIPLYAKRILGGSINRTPDIRIERQTPAMAMVDGDNAMGHLVIRFAMERAMAMAKESGVAWVGVTNSNHAGAAAVYAAMPVPHDQIGIYAGVGSANHAAPWGGRDLLIGTNPIAVGVPALEEPPVVVDMATTNSSFGKIKVKELHGEPMPEGWMIDREGNPLLDSARAIEGLLLPIGGAKGYSLAMVIGFLAGTLNGATFGSDVVDIDKNPSTPTNTGQFVVCLDIGHFTDPGAFKRNVDRIAREMKNSDRLPGVEAIRMPGESSWAKQQDRRANGIPVTAPLLDDLNAVAADLGIEGL